MRNYLQVFSFLIVIIQQLSAQITIIENSKDRFTFEWKIDRLDTNSVKNRNSWNTILSFKGQTSVLGKFKEPAIPGYSFFLGTPQKGNVNVIVQPEIVISTQLKFPVQMQNDSSTQPDYQYHLEWISDPLYAQFNSIRTAHFYFRPVQYDPVTNTCRTMLSGKVTIEFPPSSEMKSITSGSYFSQMLKSLVLNYSVAENWKADRLAKRSVEKYPFSSGQKMVYFRIGDGHAGLNEGTTNENGIIKIPGSKILEVFGSIPITQLSLYASVKGALDVSVPQVGAIPDGISEIPLYRFDQNGNGVIDKDDYFLAYVTGASDWIYDNGSYKYVIDIYDDYRTYWLTNQPHGGLTIDKFKQPAGAGDTIGNFTNHIMYKTSTEHPSGVEGGNDWIWQTFDKNFRHFVLALDPPLLDTTFAGNISIKSSLANGVLNVSVADSSLNGNSIIKHWGNKQLKIDFEPSSDSSVCELSSIELQYKSRISAGAGMVKIPIFSSSNNGIIYYKLDNLKNEKLYIFRINSDEKKMSLIDTISGQSSGSYVWADSGNTGAIYYVCNDSAFQTLPALSSPSILQNQYVLNDLRNVSHKTDYLIISPPDFLNEAVKLATHKEKMGFKNPGIVDVNEIYRSFSGGNKDPTAIRNFLAYVKNNWTDGSELFYVVLMGYGHNNPKNFSPEKTVDYIPIYQYSNLLYEDYFACTSADSLARSQLVVGRFPCKTVSEVDAIVNKVIELEDTSKADFGPWRNRALFVADDDMQRNDPDPIMLMTPHYISSENIAKIVEAKCQSLDLRKVYLFDYPWNSDYLKPEASRAIINEINNGVAYVNYFGHGGYDVWADEHVLQKENISSMFNSKQYPLISSFSCSVGLFDNPKDECLSASLVNAPSAGASAAISSTRLAYANTNEKIANVFYSSLFDSSNVVSTGMAYYLTKVNSGTDAHRTYAFFGDPSIRFVRPERSISFQVLNATNNKSIDTISALQQIKIKGVIQKSDKTIDAQYGTNLTPAYIKIGLYNAPDSTSRKDGGTTDYRWEISGTPVFVGKTSVVNGAFEQTILVSRKISFDKAGIKLTGFAWKEKDGVAGLGSKNDLIFHGSCTTCGSSLSDTTGPQISIRPVYDNPSLGSAKASFTDKISSVLPCKFSIEVYDESGVDVSGLGPDEGLVVEIPGVLSKRSINSKFQFKEGDFHKGSASMELTDKSMKPGSYNLNISAQDMIGNVSTEAFTIEITSENDFELDHVFNYPNPFRMGRQTRFFFFPSNTSTNNISLTIKIYSLSGKLLRVFTNAVNGEVWDGRDQVGNILSPNIYLYQVTAVNYLANVSTAENKKTIKSAIKKIVIQPPN